MKNLTLKLQTTGRPCNISAADEELDVCSAKPYKMSQKELRPLFVHILTHFPLPRYIKQNNGLLNNSDIINNEQSNCRQMQMEKLAPKRC